MTTTAKGYQYPQETDTVTVYPAMAQANAVLEDARPGVSVVTTTQMNAFTGTDLWDGRIVWNTSANALYRYKLSTTTWMVISPPSSANQDVAITVANTWQTIATITPTVNGLYRVQACFDVASGSPTGGAQVTFADANGAQTLSILPTGSLIPVGAQSTLSALISAHTGTAINMQVQTSTVSNITASGIVETA
jgi:hypothetical protein